VREQIEALYRSDSRRVLATLIRLLGGFDAAEEALHDASPPRSTHGRATACRRIARLAHLHRPLQGIDRLRRGARFNAALSAAAEQLEASAPLAPDFDDSLEDDRLRLIFTCCHPALSADARIASHCEKFAAWRPRRSPAPS